MSPSRRLLLAAIALLALAACGREEEAAAEGEPTGAATSRGDRTPEPTSPQQPRTPATEEGLVVAAARAIADRDLEALQATAAPELAADLRRLHDEDPGGFWERGRRLVSDVESGFEIVHRQDDSAPRWRVLVRFESGRDETMTFTRVDGELRIDQL
ncbi:MAG: hypothetical protein ACQEXJ_08325 [Myxococcota bacterium]